MSPTERLQAAIDRLTAQRDTANEGPWMFLDGDVVMGEASDPAMAYPLIAQCDHLNDADLIVTLHRTIDAQLEILQGAHRYMLAFGDDAHEYVIGLADALLGVES